MEQINPIWTGPKGQRVPMCGLHQCPVATVRSTGWPIVRCGELDQRLLSGDDICIPAIWVLEAAARKALVAAKESQYETGGLARGALQSVVATLQAALPPDEEVGG